MKKLISLSIEVTSHSSEIEDDHPVIEHIINELDRDIVDYAKGCMYDDFRKKPYIGYEKTTLLDIRITKI